MKNIIIACMLLFGCACGRDNTKENAERMQQFVIDISNYAKERKSEFIIVPQNGSELAFNNTSASDGVLMPYISAIDGIGIEALFYNGILSVDEERLSMLRVLKSSEKIMVSDYVSDNTLVPYASQRSRDEGFIAFPREKENFHYGIIPTSGIIDENADDILKLSDAKNFLYLISTDNFSSKEDMISALKATNYDVLLIDLFFEETAFTEPEINQLKTKANGGKRLVISYINIGAAEKWRYYWKRDWRRGNPSWLKKNYSGYPDEIYVQYWNKEWQNIIYGYLDRIINAGFDGAYLDNVEVYYFLNNE